MLYPAWLLQVCTQGIARSGDRTVKPWAGVEAVASLALEHPGVMRTLNHTTVVVPAPPPRSASVRHASLHVPDLSGCALVGLPQELRVCNLGACAASARHKPAGRVQASEFRGIETFRQLLCHPVRSWPVRTSTGCHLAELLPGVAAGRTRRARAWTWARGPPWSAQRHQTWTGAKTRLTALRCAETKAASVP